MIKMERIKNVQNRARNFLLLLWNESKSAKKYIAILSEVLRNELNSEKQSNHQFY